jgi:hypothetical protein
LGVFNRLGTNRVHLTARAYLAVRVATEPPIPAARDPTTRTNIGSTVDLDDPDRSGPFRGVGAHEPDDDLFIFCEMPE